MFSVRIGALHTFDRSVSSATLFILGRTRPCGRPFKFLPQHALFRIGRIGPIGKIAIFGFERSLSDRGIFISDIFEALQVEVFVHSNFQMPK